jgi:hypothetical protein
MDTTKQCVVGAVAVVLFLAALTLVSMPAVGAQPLPPPQPARVDGDPAPAAILANGFITGVVTGDDTGMPLAGMEVDAYQPAPPYAYGYAYTDASGVYSISVPAGSYQVTFWPGDYHIAEYYDDIPYNMSGSYTPVVVTDDTVTPNINASLAAGMQIIGQVTDEATTNPLMDISINVDEPGGGYYVYGYTVGSGVYTTTPGLPAGSYRVQFVDYGSVYAAEYYTNAYLPSLATLVSLTSTNRTGIDAALSQAAVVTGVVTGPGPLSGIYIYVYFADENVYVNSTTTDAGGAYRMAGLAPTSYKLQFYDSTSQHLSEWYEDKADWDAADPIALTSGVTTTVNAELTLAGVISGTVTDEGSGLPVGNINVTAYDAATGNYIRDDNTDSSGVYRLGGLAAGSYKLYFYDYGGVYLGEYYDDKPDFTSADPVTVTAGVTATVDAQLTRAGVISGVVTDEGSGLPVENIDVNVYDAATGNYIGDDDTDSSGVYRLSGLAAGSYKLYFRDYSGIYLSEYYDDKPTLSSADPVTVTAGVTATVDVALARAGVISGVVTDEGSGLPVENIDVNVYDATTGNYISNDGTDSSGVYRLSGLAAGSYKLYFRDYSGIYLSEYYDDKPTLSSADPVTVTAGVTATVDAQLTRASVITGVVTEEGSGLLLENIDVNVYDAATNNYITDDDTDSSGVYRISGLAAGSYKLYFYDHGGVYLSEYYDDKPDLNSADPVMVTASVTTTVDAALARAGRITGRVTDAASGVGVTGVSVTAARQDGSSPDGSATTDANGYYTTSALYTGVYRVRFNPPQPYYGEDYDGFQQWDAFTPVTVTVPLTTTGINAALRTGHLITGVVTGSGPLENVYVSAYRGVSSYSSFNAYTGSDGAYRMGPLDSDYYRVYFRSNDWHAGEWYSDSESYRDSAIINVTGDVTDVNASLVAGGRITGTVTGAGGAPLANAWVYVYPAGDSDSVASGQTDAAGHYVASRGLPTGEYQVKFSAPLGYTTEWYDDRTSQASATTISVTAGVTVTVDAQLAAYTWGTITGTVTAADTGLPLNTWVYAYNSQGSSVRSVYASGGAYVLDYLPPDVYRVYFSSPPSPYMWMYYADKPAISSADRITVTAGVTVTNINQALPRGGAITGVVTDTATGAGVPGVYVYARRVVGSWTTKSIYTGVDGAYRLEGLPAGGYKVQFSPPPPFIGEWYEDATESTTQIVTVTLDTTTPDIDAALATGGVITGLVTAADTGAPLAGAYVNVYSTTGSFVTGIYVGRDGGYRTPGLPPGNYWVLFDTGPWSLYRPEWYSNAHAYGDRITVTVPALGAAPHVNAALDRGGSISGWTYSQATERPLSDVYVVAYSTPGYDYVDYAYSNKWGFYQVSGLPSDLYKVYFSKSGYEVQWYDRAVDFASALTVTVSVPDDTPEINAYLRYPYEVYLPLVMRSGS